MSPEGPPRPLQNFLRKVGEVLAFPSQQIQRMNEEDRRNRAIEHRRRMLLGHYLNESRAPLDTVEFILGVSDEDPHPEVEAFGVPKRKKTVFHENSSVNHIIDPEN